MYIELALSKDNNWTKTRRLQATYMDLVTSNSIMESTMHSWNLDGPRLGCIDTSIEHELHLTPPISATTTTATRYLMEKVKACTNLVFRPRQK